MPRRFSWSSRTWLAKSAGWAEPCIASELLTAANDSDGPVTLLVGLREVGARPWSWGMAGASSHVRGTWKNSPFYGVFVWCFPSKKVFPCTDPDRISCFHWKGDYWWILKETMFECQIHSVLNGQNHVALEIWGSKFGTKFHGLFTKSSMEVSSNDGCTPWWLGSSPYGHVLIPIISVVDPFGYFFWYPLVIKHDSGNPYQWRFQ